MIEIADFLIFVTLYCLSLYVAKIFFQNKSTTKPPGPWGLPVIGHLPLFGEDSTETFKKWRQTYGDVFRIRMGSWNTVVINGYAAVKDMEKLGDVFSGRPNFISTRLITKRNHGEESLGFGTFNSSYIQLRKHSARALRLFTNINIEFTQNLIHGETDKMIDKLLSWKGEPNFINEVLETTVGSIIFSIVYGKEVINAREDKYVRVLIDAINDFNKLTKSGNPLDVVPWLRFFLPWKLNTCFEIMNKTEKIRQTMVEEHIAKGVNEDARDMTEIFLATDLPDKVQEKSESVSKTRLVHILNDFIGAGFDTSNTIMNWSILYMIAYPDVQTRVQRKIDEVVGCNHKVTIADRSKLSFTMATILEIMRISNIVPFALPHSVTCDAEFRGYRIEKDTVALVNIHSINMDESYWKDPKVFRPDRLLNKENVLDKEKSNHVIPFGLGRRKCIGEHLAKMEIFILFTTLMQSCCFSKAPEDNLDLDPVQGLVWRPKPFRVIVYKRY